jgi:hypothetical protein
VGVGHGLVDVGHHVGAVAAREREVAAEADDLGEGADADDLVRAGQGLVAALVAILDHVLLGVDAAAQGQVLVDVVLHVAGRGAHDVQRRALARAHLGQGEQRRVGDVEAVGDDRRAVVGAGVVGVAVDVVAIELERDLLGHRIGRVGHADPALDPQAVAEVVLTGQGHLAELGVVALGAVLRADVDLVEHAVGEGVAVVDRVVADDRAADAGRVGAAERDGFEVGALGELVQVRIQDVQVEPGLVGRLPLGREGQAQALGVDLRGGVARDARIEGVLHLGQVGRGGAGRATGEVVGRVAALPAGGVEAFRHRLALGIGHRGQHAEGLVLVGPAEQAGGARQDAVGDAVEAALGRGGRLEAVIVERTAGLQVDRRAQRAFRRVGRLGLAHGDAVEQLRGEDVEVEAAAAVAAAGGDGVDAVDAHAGEVGVQAAHRDLVTFAADAVDGHARQALDGFGQVLVGEGRDVLGHDGVDRPNAVALDV